MNCRFIFIVFILYVHSASYGQDHESSHTSQEKAVHYTNKVIEKIDLSQQKQDSLTLIFKDYFDDMTEYRSQHNEKLTKAVEQSRDGKVHQLLANDDQYKEYHKIMEQLRPARTPNQGAGGHRGQGQGGHR
jgi:hypothetical protein